jgi:hypothetical protein
VVRLPARFLVARLGFALLISPVLAMTAEDGVRLLTLLSGVVLFYSTWLQLNWQRTQAKRDEEAVRKKASAPAGSTMPVDAEAANVAKFKQVQVENAVRPFFDVTAYRYFLWGFAVSVISAALDLLAHGALKEFFGIAH